MEPTVNNLTLPNNTKNVLLGNDTSLKLKTLKFFFPFWPVKVFKTVTGICVLAALLGLSILLNLFKVPIVAGITISFAWLPGIIIGWYFGPVVGLLMGFVIDTINWLIYGGIWFWLYALQEPFLGLIIGLISGMFMLVQQTKYHFKLTIILNQIFFLCFLFVSIFIVFYYTDPNNPMFNKLSGSGIKNTLAIANQYLKWVILALLLTVFGIVEGIMIYQLVAYNKVANKDVSKFETYSFVIIIVLTSTVIFSFLLGPISAVEYYKFINNVTQVPNLINYGVIYYLLPRVIKECFKTPIYIAILSVLICALNPTLINLKNRLLNSYHTKES